MAFYFTLLPLASAQTAQQYVYASAPNPPSAASAVVGFSKASQTGALNLLSASPFNERFEGGLVAIDGQGKFLFVLNPTSDDISMFQINQSTGPILALQPWLPAPTVPSVSPSIRQLRAPSPQLFKSPTMRPAVRKPWYSVALALLPYPPSLFLRLRHRFRQRTRELPARLKL